MVHPCDKTCGNKTESGYCATTACINPQYSNIGTAQYGLTFVYVYSQDNSDIYRGMANMCTNCNRSYIKGFDVGESEHGSYISIEVY